MEDSSDKDIKFAELIINLPLELNKEILGFLVDIITSKWRLAFYDFVKDSGKNVYWTNKSMKVYHQLIHNLVLNHKILVNCLGNYIGCIELKSIRNLTPPIYHFFIIKDYYVDHTCYKCKDKERSYFYYEYKKDKKCDHCLRESSSVQCCPRVEILYIGQKIDYAIYQLLVEKCGKSTCSCASTYSDILMRKILLEDIKKNFI